MPRVQRGLEAHNRGQARHVVSLQLRHYMKLAMDLGMLDGIVSGDEMDTLLEQMP